MSNVKDKALKSLSCLYLATDEHVADDVNANVRAYIKELEDSVQQAFKDGMLTAANVALTFADYDPYRDGRPVADAILQAKESATYDTNRKNNTDQKNDTSSI